MKRKRELIPDESKVLWTCDDSLLDPLNSVPIWDRIVYDEKKPNHVTIPGVNTELTILITTFDDSTQTKSLHDDYCYAAMMGVPLVPLYAAWVDSEKNLHQIFHRYIRLSGCVSRIKTADDYLTMVSDLVCGLANMHRDRNLRHNSINPNNVGILSDSENMKWVFSYTDKMSVKSSDEKSDDELQKNDAQKLASVLLWVLSFFEWKTVLASKEHKRLISVINKVASNNSETTLDDIILAIPTR